MHTHPQKWFLRSDSRLAVVPRGPRILSASERHECIQRHLQGHLFGLEEGLADGDEYPKTLPPLGVGGCVVQATPAFVGVLCSQTSVLAEGVT